MMRNCCEASTPCQAPSRHTEDDEEAATVRTRREITRAATVDEIKRTALALMHEQGSTDIRFADIARAMSMTAPGLYRYFSGRDELMTALVEDAFTDLGDALEKALTAASEDPTERLLAVARAYRGWGTGDPTRFAVVFGLPVGGYVPKAEASGWEAADRAFGFLTEPVLAAVAAGIPVRPPLAAVSDKVRFAFCEKPPMDQLDPALAQALMHAWASLHGFVCLEAFGQMKGMPGEVADEMFEALIVAVANYLRLPPAP